MCKGEHVGSTLRKKQKMPYNPNIHHRRIIRLKGYDYKQGDSVQAIKERKKK